MISGDRDRDRDRDRWTLVRSGLLGTWVYQGLQHVVGRVRAGAAGGAAVTADVGPWCGAVCSVLVRIKVAESGGVMGCYARLWFGVWDGLPRMWWRCPVGGIGVHQLDCCRCG